MELVDTVLIGLGAAVGGYVLGRWLESLGMLWLAKFELRQVIAKRKDR